MKRPAIDRQVKLSGFAVLGLLYLLAAPQCGSRKSAQSEPEKPNILFIFTDDQKWNTIGYLGNDEIRTPNLDRLAEQSFVFTNAYCFGGNTGAVCIPSRNMLMSGKVFFRFEQDAKRCAEQQLERRAPWYTDPDWPSIPKSMQQAGYETYYREKSGSANNPDIREQFDHREDIHMVDALRTGRPARGIVDDAIAFMGEERDCNKPFFMYLGFPCPHDPRWATKQFRDLYDPSRLSVPPNYLPLHPWNIGDMTIRDECLEGWPRTEEAIRRHLHDYYAVISSMDYDIGRLLRAVDSLEVADNTIVVFSSDQGLAIGDHGLMGKQNIYEGTMKVPLLFRGPDILPGNSDAFVYVHDLYPTFCEMAATAVPEGLDGRSLLGIIRGQASTARDHVVLAYRNTQRSIRIGHWKYIRYPRVDRSMLFDLAKDPYEVNNLADMARHALRVDHLKMILEKELRHYGDTIDLDAKPVADPVFTPPESRPETPYPAGGPAPGDPAFDNLQGSNNEKDNYTSGGYHAQHRD